MRQWGFVHRSPVYPGACGIHFGRDEPSADDPDRPAVEPSSPPASQGETLGPLRVLAVSPHLDDAILSAGAALGNLASRQHSVHVLTLFAGDAPTEVSPMAQHLHGQWRLGAGVAAERRSEDQEACRLLGLQPHHGAHCDVIYRKDSEGGWVCESSEDLYTDSVAAEVGMILQLDQSIVAVAEEVRPDVLFAPLGIGRHIDHLLVNAAALQVAKRLHLPLVRWHDVPYRQRERFYEVSTDLNELTVECTAAKLSAAECYVSQLATLWPHGDWRERLVADPEVLRFP